MVCELTFNRVEIDAVEQEIVQGLALLAGVSVIVGGVLSNAGILRLKGKPDEGGKCLDRDCNRMVRDHDIRLARGDVSIKNVQDKQSEHSAKLDQIAEDVAFLRGKYEREGRRG